MKNRSLKIMIIVIMTIVFSSPILKVYAEDSLIDLVSLAREKVFSIVGVLTQESITDIENKSDEVENDILNYVDDYIKGLEDELDKYADQQTNEAENRLDDEYKNVKINLDNQRQLLIDEGKSKIDEKIDQKYKDELDKLRKNLNNKLVEKFK